MTASSCDTTSSDEPRNGTSVPEAVERIAASVVGVLNRHHRGAGIAWRPGVVVASASVLRHATRATLVLPDGGRLDAELRGRDRSTDLAALTYGGDALALPARAAPAPARVGDFVCAVARDPSGATQASFGRLGRVGPAWRSGRGGHVDQLLQLDGGLYPGMQGSAAADAAGRLLGLASGAFSHHHAIVLPAVTVERVLDELLQHGRVRHGHLGIAAQPAVAQIDGQPTHGLLVSAIAPAGPAARAGLMVGDVIVAAAGTPVQRPESLRALLPVDAAVTLSVARAGARHALVVQVTERPAPCGG